jgi:hypothetical protein
MSHRFVRNIAVVAILLAAGEGEAFAQPVEPVFSLAKGEKQPLLDTIEPHLYLLARMIIDISRGKDR